MHLHPLLQQLGLRHPIIQAPMAGGADGPALAAAVSAAGGLGSLGVAYLSPAAITAAAHSVAARTNRAFALNLFAPTPLAPPAPAAPVLAALAPYHAELGLPPPTLADDAPLEFDDQFQAALHSGAAVLSFTFGLLPPTAMRTARDAGKILIGTATTVAEARALADSGAHAVVAQGAEAGGHRGSFAAAFGRAMIGTMALVPQIVDAVDIPVIASGGIMDGRGIAASLMLGAAAVQMGTAFLPCAEAGAPAVHTQAVLTSQAEDTAITAAFSGRPARGIHNRFMAEMDPCPTLGFPRQNAATRPMRAAAAAQGRAAFLSLWAGQGTAMARALPAAVLINALGEELAEIFTRFTAPPA
jgi:nitronate monooxygenase